MLDRACVAYKYWRSDQEVVEDGKVLDAREGNAVAE